MIFKKVDKRHSLPLVKGRMTDKDAARHRGYSAEGSLVVFTLGGVCLSYGGGRRVVRGWGYSCWIALVVEEGGDDRGDDG